jgi:hypothetical protein
MQRWMMTFPVLVGLLAGCAGKAEPLNIRRDAFKTYLSESSVGTEEIVNETLPSIRLGRKASVSARDELGARCHVSVYVDRANPMLLHVVTTRQRPCPECNGTGVRRRLGGLPMRCLNCDGTGNLGKVANHKRHRVASSDLAVGEAPPP